MRRSFPAASAAVAALVVGLGLLTAATQPVGAAPEPTSTHDVPVSVIIPQQSTPPNPPAPQPSPSSTRQGSSTPTPTPPPSTCTPTTGDTPPTPAAQATDAAGTLTLDHESVAAGGWLLAKGSGYAAGERVQVVLYPGPIAITETYKADAGGNVAARIRIPADTRSGDYIVEGTGWASCVVTNGDVEVTSDADLAAFPWLWWVLIVLGVLVVAAIVTGLYFRDAIRRWLTGGAAAAAEPAT